MVGLPDIEVLEGPKNVALSIREEQVLPRRQGCAAKVAGGTLVLTAKDVTEPAEAKLTYRVNYKTKDGPRQTSHAFMVSLFPDHWTGTLAAADRFSIAPLVAAPACAVNSDSPDCDAQPVMCDGIMQRYDTNTVGRRLTTNGSEP